MDPKQSFFKRILSGIKNLGGSSTTYNRQEALASPLPALRQPQKPAPRDTFLSNARSTPAIQNIQPFQANAPAPAKPDRKLVEAIAINETGGLGVSPEGVLTSPNDMVKGVKHTYATEEQKYAYKRPAPVEDSPNNVALGKYQVTSDELATYATRYLGRSITPDEFSGSPELQEAYMDGKTDYYLELGYTPQQIADMHRRGIKNSSDPGSDKYQDPEYVEKFNQNFYGALEDNLN